MKNLLRAFVWLVLFLGVSNILAQSTPEEFLKREVKVGTETYGYRIYVPKNHNRKNKSPIMLFLHGHTLNGTDNERHVRGINELVYQHPEIFNFIIVFPQARPNNFWLGEMMTQAVKALDQTVEEFNGDTRKLYLGGMSMGGYGTWATAVMYPNKFAALVPIAGGIVPPYELPKFFKQFLPAPFVAILDAPDPYHALAKCLTSTPVWIFHGSDDEIVPVTESRKIKEALKKNGNANVVYTEFEKTNHNDVFLKAFLEPNLYRWLAKQELKKMN